MSKMTEVTMKTFQFRAQLLQEMQAYLQADPDLRARVEATASESAWPFATATDALSKTLWDLGVRNSETMKEGIRQILRQMAN